ncbi:hypothetical protein Tco_0865549 [Tanacetum coccineum]
MGSNEETIRLVQEAEKQRLLAQKVQQENTTLSSQLELLKERNRILEGINKDHNYLEEFLEADEWAKRYYNQAQSQWVRDRDIIRDLEKQREKLELDVKDHKRQKEEYQKTQTIFKQTQRDKEEKYLNDIIQLQDKIKDLENVVCKMDRSTDTLRLLTSEQKAFRDNLHKSGVGYNGSCVLSQAYAKISKLYRASELCDKNEQLHVFDSEETLKDAEKSQLKMNEFQKDEKIQELKIQPIDYEKLNKLYKEFAPQKQLFEPSVYFDDFQNLFQRDIKEMKDAFEQNDVYLDEIENQNDLLKDQLLEASLTEDIKNLVITSWENFCDNAECEFQTKFVELEKVLTQQTKDFNDVKLELSNRTAKFEAYFEKLEKMKVVLERQLARKVDDSKAEKDQF